MDVNDFYAAAPGAGLRYVPGRECGNKLRHWKCGTVFRRESLFKMDDRVSVRHRPKVLRTRVRYVVLVLYDDNEKVCEKLTRGKEWTKTDGCRCQPVAPHTKGTWKEGRAAGRVDNDAARSVPQPRRSPFYDFPLCLVFRTGVPFLFVVHPGFQFI